MSYKDFVWFILSEEDKSNDVSLEYWFRCIDLDDDGQLRSNEMLVSRQICLTVAIIPLSLTYDGSYPMALLPSGAHPGPHGMLAGRQLFITLRCGLLPKHIVHQCFPITHQITDRKCCKGIFHSLYILHSSYTSAKVIAIERIISNASLLSHCLLCSIFTRSSCTEWNA